MDKKREIALLAVASAAFDFCDDHRLDASVIYDGHFQEMVRTLNYLRSVEYEEEKERRVPRKASY